MKKAPLFSVSFIPLVTACVSTNADVPRDHPAHPAAPVTQVALTPALATTPATAEEAAPAAHQHDGHHQHEHGQHAPNGQQAPKTATSGNTPAAAAATAASAGATNQSDKPTPEVWTCPMHPEIAKNGPGQCPICGMNLVKRGSGKAK
jgi:hypothetical protein